MVSWGFSIENERVAVPILMVGNEGKLVGAKWQVVGGIKPKAVKAEQIWPEAEKDVFVEIKLDDLTEFSFYNKCRNVSGWLDSDTISWVAFKKEDKSKAVIPTDQHGACGIRKFSIRIGVLPISGSQGLSLLPSCLIPRKS